MRQGWSGVSLVNDPQRIVKPMKRTGPRGDGEWQVISWQQAYQEIAAKMNAIKAQHGPESVAFFQIGLALQPSFPSGYGLWFA